MADHLKPTNASTYANYTNEINGRVDDALKGLDPATTTATNVPTNSIRWNSASGLWQKWSGTAWNALASLYNIVVSKAQNLVGGNNTTLLGAIPYQSNTDTTTLLAPNTTTTRKFLRQTGTGTNGYAPVWDTLVASDIPTLNQNTTGSSGSCTGNSATATTANALNTSNSYTGLGFTANGGALRSQNWDNIPTNGVVYFGNVSSCIFKNGGAWYFNNQQGFNNVLGTNGNIVTENGGTWSINATTATSAGSCTGNSATATSASKLTTARTINGVYFDGSTNITIPTGGSTNYGDIGTYVIAAEDTFVPSVEFLPNVLVPGSSLIRSNNTAAITSMNAIINTAMHVGSSGKVSLGLAGTWRRLTRGYSYTSNVYSPLNLYVRVS